MLARPNLAAKLFWPSIDPAQSEIFVAYSYLLNTLHNEYRFVASGIHSKQIFNHTLKFFIETIDEEFEVKAVMQLVQTLGFGDDFVEAALPIMELQLQKLRANAKEVASAA